MSEVTVKVSGGGKLQTVELNPQAALITEGDMLYALQRQRAKILRNTEAGLDVEGKAFAPYSTKRPYYWYPAGKVGKKRDEAEMKREKSNVGRAAKKLGGTKSRSGLGVRFESYDAFKRKGLGRSNVDLRGPRAPHMLQEIVTKTGGVALAANQQTAAGLYDNLAPVKSGTIGIYGDAAKRASGHNSEAGRPKGLPRRWFLGASAEDEKRFAGDIEKRAGERANQNKK
jgi:hypothetical protein